jgi:hypothetical protein
MYIIYNKCILAVGSSHHVCGKGFTHFLYIIHRIFFHPVSADAGIDRKEIVMNQSHNYDYYRKQAKQLLQLFRKKDLKVLSRLRTLHRFSNIPPPKIFSQKFQLYEAQYIVALENNFKSWRNLKQVCKSQEEERMEKKLKSIKVEGNNSFGACLAGIMNYWKVPVEYDLIIGLTGGICSPVFNKQENCGAWWMEGGDDYRIIFAGQVLGFSTRILSHNEDSNKAFAEYSTAKKLPEKMESYWNEINRDFLDGKMVILKTWPTWSVLTGWNNDLTKLPFATQPGYENLCAEVWGPNKAQKAYILTKTKPSITEDQGIREAIEFASQLASGEFARDHFEYGGVLFRKSKDRMKEEYFCSECKEESTRCAYRTIARMKDVTGDTVLFFEKANTYFKEEEKKQLIEHIINMCNDMFEIENRYSNHQEFTGKWAD